MNKFEKQLEKWNHGVLRGAQAKLAKILGVSTATTALWATGKRRPSKGYISKMASLFKMDVYHVVKLFQSSAPVVYPLPVGNNSSNVLYDSDTNSSYQLDEYSAQSNSVQIPFLNTPAETFPYPEDNILEWWSLPRRYAQGARYIVRSQTIGFTDATSEDDVCFIKPATQPADKQIVLLVNDKQQYVVRRAVQKNATFQYVSLTGKAGKTPLSFRPIGVVTHRVKPL